MNRCPVYDETSQQYGWDTTSYDHHPPHDSRTERVPSGVITDDAPRYPNVHQIFNKKMTYEEEAPRKEHSRHKNQKKKVLVVETIEEDVDPKGRHDYEEIVEETIDSSADSFIQQRHKAFELRKWNTFK